MDILNDYVCVYQNDEDELSEIWNDEEVEAIGRDGEAVLLRGVGLIGIDWHCEVYVEGEYMGRATESEFDGFLLVLD